jgi:hypothetical protein
MIVVEHPDQNPVQKTLIGGYGMPTPTADSPSESSSLAESKWA